MALVLGIDVSTTATKAVLVDEAGHVAAIGVAEYGFETPQPLWSEQDPGLWWDAAHNARSKRRSRRPASRGVMSAAVGLTGQMHGLVVLDDADEVLRPAILWNDQRTAAECDLIRAAVGPERLIEITGNDAVAGLTAPKLVWIREHEPDIWRRIAARPAAQGLPASAADRRSRDGQGGRRRHPAVRPRRARLVVGGR